MTDFTERIEPLLGELREFLYRIVAHAEDADDVLQETLLAVHQAATDDLSDADFRLRALAAATAQAGELLAGRPRWAPSSYAAAMDEASGVPSDRDAIGAVISSPRYHFDIGEHMAFCLITVGRSLAPAEACAVQLRDVMQLSASEAARVLDPDGAGTEESMSEAIAVAARDTLVDVYEDLCALQNPQGACSLCKELHEGVAREARVGEMVELNRASAAEAWEQRMGIVRKVTLTECAGKPLHDLLLRGIARRELDPTRDN